MSTLWTLTGRIAAKLNERDGTGADQTATRLLKVTEEAGEAASAYIGMTGQNPHKGITHAPVDVADELCDLIIAAAVALHDFTSTPPVLLEAKLAAAAHRLEADTTRTERAPA